MSNAPIEMRHLAVGEQAKVLGYDRTCRTHRQHLLSMGLTPGTIFTLTRIAPLGDPVEIQLRGYALSLRKAEANILQLEKVEPCPSPSP